MPAEFENDFEVEASTEATVPAVEEIQAEAEAILSEVAGEPVSVVIAEADEDEEPEDDDFFAEEDAPAVPEVDPATILTIRTSQGKDVFVPAPQPMPLVDAIAASGLRFNGDFTCWLNGQEVGLGTQVAGGMTVTVVGAVKGG